MQIISFFNATSVNAFCVQTLMRTSHSFAKFFNSCLYSFFCQDENHFLFSSFMGHSDFTGFSGTLSDDENPHGWAVFSRFHIRTASPRFLQIPPILMDFSNVFRKSVRKRKIRKVGAIRAAAASEKDQSDLWTWNKHMVNTPNIPPNHSPSRKNSTSFTEPHLHHSVVIIVPRYRLQHTFGIKATDITVRVAPSSTRFPTAFPQTWIGWSSFRS